MLATILSVIKETTMKNVLILLMLIVGLKAYGEVPYKAPSFLDFNIAGEKAPAPLTDSTIERTLDNGQVQKFDGNEWMIVKRGPKKKKAVVVPSAPVAPTVITKTVIEKAKPRKNRVSLLAGRSAKEGLSVQNNSTSAEIESKVGAVVGVQYQRLITERISIGAEVLSSKAALVNVGYEF
jgi:hypothetical protein